MACPSRYAALPCNLTGVGFSAMKANLATGQLLLQRGHGSQFPTLNPGQFFLATIADACGVCCETVRVVGIDGDTLLFERPAPRCDCVASNSRVRYDSHSVDAIRAIAADLGIEVKFPLVYDCETRQLSIDCAGLKQMVENPCA